MKNGYFFARQLTDLSFNWLKCEVTLCGLKVFRYWLRNTWLETLENSLLWLIMLLGRYFKVLWIYPTLESLLRSIIPIILLLPFQWELRLCHHVEFVETTRAASLRSFDSCVSRSALTPIFRKTDSFRKRCKFGRITSRSQRALFFVIRPVCANIFAAA